MFKKGDIVYIKSQYDAGLKIEYPVKRIINSWIVIEIESMASGCGCKDKGKKQFQEMSLKENALILKQ
jgi:hypothetical protein